MCISESKNINEIIEKSGFKGNIGLLSIDIDGNDYWILNSIDIVLPDIIIIEYNANFGSDESITIKFEENFQRGTKGLSKLIYGCSIKAAVNLCNKRLFISLYKYNGNNVFFVKNTYTTKNEVIDYKNVNKNTFKEFNNDEGFTKEITDDQLKKWRVP